MTRYCPHSGKLVHESQSAAAGAVRRLNRKGKHRHGGKVYHCRHCDGWHHARASPDELAAKRINRAAARHPVDPADN